jgi:hypothetical protein
MQEGSREVQQCECECFFPEVHCLQQSLVVCSSFEPRQPLNTQNACVCCMQLTNISQTPQMAMTRFMMLLR